MKTAPKKRPWFTHAILSAVLLYGFEIGFGIFASFVWPYIAEIWEKSPRFGALALLGLFLSPIGFVAIFHRAVSGAMDKFDARRERRGFFPGVGSLWAGCVAWFVSTLASLVSAFLYFAIFPPPPREDSIRALEQLVVGLGFNASVHTLLWIFAASTLFAIERAARKSED